MKRTVLFSSTILAIITVLELSQASTAMPTPSTAKITVNESVETPFDSNQSIGGGAEIEMVENIRVRDSSCLGRAKNKSYFQ